MSMNEVYYRPYLLLPALLDDKCHNPDIPTDLLCLLAQNLHLAENFADSKGCIASERLLVESLWILSQLSGSQK